MNNPEIPIGTTVHINPEEIKWNSNGDLISREALKNAINDNGCRHSHYFDIFDVIDNAPTVRNEYMRGYEAAEREYKRPQGAWIEGISNSTSNKYCKCSNCNFVVWNYVKFNFCPQCGAEMQKGGAE